MKNLRVNPNDLLQWLKNLQKEREILVPMQEENVYNWAEWDGTNLPADDYQNTLKPPKDLFFPQHEVLVKYQVKKGEKPTIKTPDLPTEKRVIYGIRPCDATSLEILDKVFLEQDFQDPFYKARRENTLVISLVCQQEGIGCFCTDFLTTRGSDIQVIKLDDNYIVRAITEKGEESLKSLGGESADQETLAKINEISLGHEEIAVTDLHEKLADMFDHPLWEEIQMKCLNCGVCSFLCPTCHCFDITDDQKGQRIRSWDCCMFTGFTKQASGHNPRPSGTERIRQRFMHKFSYFPERYGEVACVGCGRCVEKCPVNLDIRQVIKAIKEVG